MYRKVGYEHNIIRYAYYMNENVDSVWKMTCKDFRSRMKHMEAILAEGRYILQRQIDNNIKLNNKETIKDFTEIYKEFSNQMKEVEVIVFNNKEISNEEKKKIHKENLAKMGLS